MLRISKQCAILTNATTTIRFSTPTTLFNRIFLQGSTDATTTTTTTTTTLNFRQFSADAATKSNNDQTTHSSQNRGGPANTDQQNKNDEQEILLKLKQTFQNDINSGGIIPIYKKALLYGNKVAIKDSIAEYSYAQLYNGAKQLSIQISNICGSGSSSKVAFLCTNNAVYTLIQWACWFSGQIAVPLNPRHPSNILEYYVKDSDAQLLITIPEYENCMNGLAKSIERRLIIVDHTIIPSAAIINNNNNNNTTEKSPNSLLDSKQIQLAIDDDDGTLNSQFYAKSDAMIVYTSGSTGKPKGVMITHRNLDSQLKNLTHAWQINDKDSMLHVLPLNHIHGIVNALMCPLSVGAKVFMQSQFESHSVWSALLNVNMPTKDQITLFMGVPTIYSLLITEYVKTFSKNERMVDYIRSQCEKRIRLMISGSAPLPITVFNRWHEITGHKLLERYGMTEIGMVLSNPYIIDKTRGRIPGSVGLPLPDAEIKLVHENQTLIEMKGECNKNYWSMTKILPDTIDIKNKSTIDLNMNKVNDAAGGDAASSQSPPPPPPSGELYVRGPMVFREYYKKPNETKSVFDENGWFKTGDEAKYENGVFKVMGRKSVDIIKTGGYKVSALEIETHLMEHSAIADVCVIGVADDIWGQKIAALIVCKDKTLNEIPDFQKWCSKNISGYQIPTIVKIIDEIPRNAMGKINKKEILIEFFQSDDTKKVE